MSWTYPKTWITEPLTSLDMNRYIRDNQFDLDGRMRSFTVLRDEKPQATPGGTFTAGAWQQRELNTKYGDPIGWVTLNANQFTLADGEYVVRAQVPAFAGVGMHQARLYNISNSTTTQYGTVSSAGAASMVTHSLISVTVQLSSATTFEIQHRCAVTINTNGFGALANFATEVYTQVEIWRIGQ